MDEYNRHMSAEDDIRGARQRALVDSKAAPLPMEDRSNDQFCRCIARSNRRHDSAALVSRERIHKAYNAGSEMSTMPSEFGRILAQSAGRSLLRSGRRW